MFRTYLLLIILFFTFNLNAQLFIAETEAVDADISWPWNWDIISDGERLMCVNKIGILNIKNGDTWENLALDPDNSNIEARGIALGQDGKIWITTTAHGLWSYDANSGFQQFTSTNSFLPVDQLRSLAIHDNVMWISTDGLGLIRHDFASDETTHFTKELYPDLKSNHNLDPYIDEEGNVWFTNREFLTRISADLEWTNEDMRYHIGGSGVQDMHIVSTSEIWLAMDGGLVLYDGEEYNVIFKEQFHRYIEVFKDAKGDIWLSRISTLLGDGISVMRGDQTYFFASDDHPGVPSQVFEFIEHQDTVIAVGTISNYISKLVFDVASITEDNEAIDRVNIYPNPASGEIHIDGGSTGLIKTWTFYDMSGRKALEKHTSALSLDISGLKDGNYILTLDTENRVISKQISIKNSK